MIYVIGPKDKIPTENCIIINTTSKGNYAKDFSPFILGPVIIRYTETAKNLENFWQFSKVYKDHVDENNEPTEEYFKWRNKGFQDLKAHRYPKGKGAKPLYSLDYYNGLKLDYISARKRIYIPHYSKLVQQTEGFKKLKDSFHKEDRKDIYLWDFDGYNHIEKKMTLQNVIHSEKYKMGHAFVIWGLLTEQLDEAMKEPIKEQVNLCY